METKDYLKLLKDEMHTTVFATVDDMGLPVTRVIDIMLADDTTFYFITAKGKAFYSQLMKQKYVAVSGMTGGEGSMSKKSVSVRGQVENLGNQLLDRVFEENPYMAEIYPSKESRMALEVFRLLRGQGEYFDLSSKPITRERFLLGEDHKRREPEAGSYFITDKCHGCRACYSKCPQNCIDFTGKLPVIRQENCLHCGNCYEICPFRAVEKRK